MGPAVLCPSRQRGYCKVADHCYALADETFYGDKVRLYRMRQAIYWLTHNGVDMLKDFDILFHKYKRSLAGVKYLRMNESGDFWGQRCVSKLSYLAHNLKESYNILTYCNSARRDLDFSKALFKVKSSGYDNGNNGQCIVIDKAEELPEGWKLCPGKCSECSMCKERDGVNVAFRRHR